MIKLDIINKKIVEEINAGKKQPEIARELGITRIDVANRVQNMRKQGVKISRQKRGPKKRTTTDETDRRILEGLLAGKSQEEIKKNLGLGSATISNRIQKMRERGIDIPKQKRGPKKGTESYNIDNAILKGIAEGKTLTKIAKELNLTKQCISERIKKMRAQGIEITKQKRGPKRRSENVETDNKILEKLAEGKQQKEIAKELNVTPQSISKRVQRIKERGSEALTKIRENKENESDKIDNKILAGMLEGKTQKEIGKEIGYAQTGVSRRIRTMGERDKENKEQLAKMIVNLTKTKNATPEQVKKIGEYYNVGEYVEELLNSLDKQEEIERD